MIIKLGYGILAVLLLISAVFMKPPASKDPGSVPMAPFVDETFGIRGMAPAGGLSQTSILLQQSTQGTLGELEAILVEQTELSRVPDPTGTYSGRCLTWYLYEFETRIKSAGPWFYQVHMGLAKSETGYYNVVLAARPTEYRANRARYLAAFEHAMYALEPLQ